MYLDKIKNLTNDYNSGIAKIHQDFEKLQYEPQKEGFIENAGDKLKKEFLSKLKNETENLLKAQEQIRSNYFNAFYGNMNTTAGELQLAEAKPAIEKGEEQAIFDLISEGLKLNRVVLVSYLLHYYHPNDQAAFDQFWIQFLEDPSRKKAKSDLDDFEDAQTLALSFHKQLMSGALGMFNSNIDQLGQSFIKESGRTLTDIIESDYVTTADYISQRESEMQ